MPVILKRRGKHGREETDRGPRRKHEGCCLEKATDKVKPPLLVLIGVLAKLIT